MPTRQFHVSNNGDTCTSRRKVDLLNSLNVINEYTEKYALCKIRTMTECSVSSIAVFCFWLVSIRSLIVLEILCVYTVNVLEIFNIMWLLFFIYLKIRMPVIFNSQYIFSSTSMQAFIWQEWFIKSALN